MFFKICTNTMLSFLSNMTSFHQQVATSLTLTYPTLTLWSVVLFQFTLAIGTTKEKKTKYVGAEGQDTDEDAAKEEEE